MKIRKRQTQSSMAAMFKPFCEDPESKLSSTFLFTELDFETSVKCCVPDKPVC